MTVSDMADYDDDMTALDPETQQELFEQSLLDEREDNPDLKHIPCTEEEELDFENGRFAGSMDIDLS